jgi:hypothetical protein
MEQTFVVDSLPARGELRCAHRRAHRARSFARLGTARVLERVSAAFSTGEQFAIDSDGRRADAPTRLVDGSIEIVVPAAFIESATFPLTIDPLVTAFAINDSTEKRFQSRRRVRLRRTTATSWFYERAVQRDRSRRVLAALHTRAGVPVVGGSAWIDSSPTSIAAHPRVANNNAASVFLAVAEVGLALEPGSRHLRPHARVDRNDRGQRALVERVVREPRAVSTRTSVVIRIRRAPRTSASCGNPTTVRPCTGPKERSWIRADIPLLSLDVAFSLCRRSTSFPSISKSNGSPPTYEQVWTVSLAAPGAGLERSRHLRDADPSQRIDRCGGRATSSIDSSSNDDTRPAVSSIVDGSSRWYLVAYERDYGTNHGIIGRVAVGAIHLWVPRT